MTDSSQPFAAKKFLEIKGRRMAYIDEGEGAPIVFAHGNPTSSYPWRNVMPACRGLGRLVACDMIGMGDSEKLPDSGPDRYTYAEQRSFLFALWEKLGIHKDVVFVLHDWGSLLGFDWTRCHAERVQGVVYMEAIVQPIAWADWPEYVRPIFQGFRSKDGEEMGDKTLKVWDLASGRELRTLTGHSDFVTAVALTPDGKQAVSASRDQTIKVWDLETGTVVGTFTCDGAALCCAFAGDAKIVAADAGGRVHFLHLEEPKSRN